MKKFEVGTVYQWPDPYDGYYTHYFTVKSRDDSSGTVTFTHKHYDEISDANVEADYVYPLQYAQEEEQVETHITGWNRKIKLYAGNTGDDGEEYYTPCACRGDYSPLHPWDAPGMSVRDFI